MEAGRASVRCLPSAEGAAAKGEYPKPEDNFRWRYFGLFYVAPAQNSYMCRLRIPNGILTHWQLAGMADVAERLGGGYAHVTTRANLQIREIEAKNTIAVIEKIIDLGPLLARLRRGQHPQRDGKRDGGHRPQELADTRPLAREWHHHILNSRTLYGLPRKFNVAFDGGGGLIPTLEETNDIGFQAVMVGEGGRRREPRRARPLVAHRARRHHRPPRSRPALAASSARARIAPRSRRRMIKVFIAAGDRTDRAKARLKYVLDSWGFEKFVHETEGELGRPLARIPESAIAPRPAFDRAAHVGVHRQSQAGLNWIGVALPSAN